MLMHFYRFYVMFDLWFGEMLTILRKSQNNLFKAPTE